MLSIFELLLSSSTKVNSLSFHYMSLKTFSLLLSFVFESLAKAVAKLFKEVFAQYKATADF